MTITPRFYIMETAGFRAILKQLPLWGLGFSLFLCGGCANRIFYQPSRRMAPAPDQRGIRYQAVDFQSTDGTALTGWWLPSAGDAKGTVVHFHGNAQNMSTHVQFADWLPAAGYHLFVFDYRGYGQSAGSPDRKGLVRDGVAALKTVSRRPEVDPDKLFVWGQSLGGTVALQSILHSDVRVQAAIIDSAFYSHSKIASDKMRHLPWFLQPLRLFRLLFVSGGYDANTAVKKLQDLPLFFIHGEDDRIIPASHSQQLHALAPENSQLWIIPGSGHCDAVLRFPAEVRPKLIRFLETAVPAP